MSQRKMVQFSAGALLLLLPLCGDLVLGEISNDFHQCQEFFYNNKPPGGIGNQYKPICQNYKSQYQFATLYNRQDRVAVYSAYILKPPQNGSNPGNYWKYEPQLVSADASPAMEDFPDKVPEDVRESQAVPDDYTSEYTKGHLAPSGHQETREDREATYTLTNIVPQREGSNNGPWKTLEEDVLKKFKQYCEGKMYVITGAIPYQPVRLLKERVSIPEYMWSAYCCPSYKPRLPQPVQSFFPTYAAVGRNDLNSGDDIVKKVKGYDVRSMTLQELERILQTTLHMQISVFDKQCRGSEE